MTQIDRRKRLREIASQQRLCAELIPERDRLIREMADHGDSLRTIAADADISKTRVIEILDE